MVCHMATVQYFYIQRKKTEIITRIGVPMVICLYLALCFQLFLSSVFSFLYLLFSFFFFFNFWRTLWNQRTWHTLVQLKHSRECFSRCRIFMVFFLSFLFLFAFVSILCLLKKRKQKKSIYQNKHIAPIILATYGLPRAVLQREMDIKPLQMAEPSFHFKVFKLNGCAKTQFFFARF